MAVASLAKTSHDSDEMRAIQRDLQHTQKQYV